MEQVGGHDWTADPRGGSGHRSLLLGPDGSARSTCPTAVIITMRDHVVPLRRQIRLFEAIPGAKAYRVDGDHDACVINADRFVPTLVSACTYVAEQARVAAAG